MQFFEEQIEFLERSNMAFDDGHLSEAKRLAVNLRVLFHHTRRSHALINQLGLANALTWVDTAGRPNRNNFMPSFGLIHQGITIKDGQGMPFFGAKLGNYPIGRMRTSDTRTLPRGSRVYFDMWWTHPLVKDASGSLFSRKEFVLALVNKEGGAHVDPDVEESYSKIAKFNSLGWTYSEGPAGRALQGPTIPVGPRASKSPLPPAIPPAHEGWSDPIPMEDPVPHMVRQISYETLESVRQQRDRIN